MSSSESSSIESLDSIDSSNDKDENISVGSIKRPMAPIMFEHPRTNFRRTPGAGQSRNRTVRNRLTNSSSRESNFDANLSNVYGSNERPFHLTGIPKPVALYPIYTPRYEPNNVGRHSRSSSSPHTNNLRGNSCGNIWSYNLPPRSPSQTSLASNNSQQRPPPIANRAARRRLNVSHTTRSGISRISQSTSCSATMRISRHPSDLGISAFRMGFYNATGANSYGYLWPYNSPRSSLPPPLLPIPASENAAWRSLNSSRTTRSGSCAGNISNIRLRRPTLIFRHGSVLNQSMNDNFNPRSRQVVAEIPASIIRRRLFTSDDATDEVSQNQPAYLDANGTESVYRDLMRAIIVGRQSSLSRPMNVSDILGRYSISELSNRIHARRDIPEEYTVRQDTSEIPFIASVNITSEDVLPRDGVTHFYPYRGGPVVLIIINTFVEYYI